MAYMNFSEAGALAAANSTTARRQDAGPATQTDFSPLEWTVISLARHDRPSGDGKPGRASRIMALLFGEDSAKPLADPRLESLRRVAVSLWRSRRATDATVDRFFQHGFTPAQFDMLGASIAAVTGRAV